MWPRTQIAAEEVLRDLLVFNSFSRHSPKAVPAVDVAEDALFSSTLLFDTLCSLSASAGESEASHIEQDILKKKCSNLVSFPDNMAWFSATQESDGTDRSARFDYALYNQKLSDAFWCFLFTESEDASQRQQKHRFARVFSQVAVRRGLSSVLFKRFLPLAASPPFLSSSGSDSKGKAAALQADLQAFTVGVLEGSTHRKSVLRKTGTTVFQLTGAWAAWMQTLLAAGEKNPGDHSVIVEYLLANSGERNAKAPSVPSAEHPSAEGNSEHDCQRQIQKYVLDTAVSKAPTPRAHLRFVYLTLLSKLTDDVSENREAPLQPLLEETLKRVFATWESKELVTVGDPVMNEVIFHSVMYALLLMKNKKHETLPPALLAPLLNGITVRLQCAHVERQSYAMAAAAAFAAFFVDNNEAAANLLQNADYSSQLQRWLTEETTRASELSPSGPFSASARPSPKATFLTQPLLVRTEIFPQNSAGSIDPDAPHFFFTLQKSSASQRDSLDVAVIPPSQLLKGHSSSSPETLPPFGTQKLEEDEMDVPILRTFRESYESLMGIGKGANAQMHETQQAIEAGLYGMAKSLGEIKKQISNSGIQVKLPTHFDPLIPSLLPAILSLAIYAPEDKTKMLYGVRYGIVVDIIQLSPKMALHTISGMIYGSNYGVYQRVEMVRAVGDAAKALASVEINEAKSGTSPSDAAEWPSRRSAGKRIYPPIPTAVTTEKRSIVLDEGKQTRRWGNAVLSRRNAKLRTRRYLNMLSEVAPYFITSLLARLDADHFKFFQESDPYVPAEILRTLTVVFQGITKARHVAPTLCEQNIEFFFAVAMRHPHITVRKQAWVATGEVMRCWCGAPPAVEATEGGYTRARDFLYSGSLMLTDRWLATLEILHSLCLELDRRKDAVFAVAALTVSMVRDLAAERKDFDLMEENLQGSGIAAL